MKRQPETWMAQIADALFLTSEDAEAPANLQTVRIWRELRFSLTKDVLPVLGASAKAARQRGRIPSRRLSCYTTSIRAQRRWRRTRGETMGTDSGSE